MTEKTRANARAVQGPCSASSSLTIKQQRFVIEYQKDANAKQAAIRAGYAAGSAEVQGCRLLRNVHVRAAVAKAQGKVSQQAEVTAKSLMAELEEARQLALKEGQASGAVAATMGKAKIGGHIVERHRHSGAVGTYDLSKLSDDELDRLESILGPLADVGGDPGGEGEAEG